MANPARCTLLLAVCCAALSLALGPAARAQGVEVPLVTDRPGFSDGTSIVAPGTFQLEGGYAFERTGGRTGHVFGQLLGRVGLSEWLEVRPALNSYVVREEPRRDVSGFEDASLGLKARLVPGDGVPLGRPQIALVANASLPTGDDGEEIGSAGSLFTAKLAADWPLSPAAALTLNVGYDGFAVDDAGGGRALVAATLGGSLSDAQGLATYVGYAGFYGRDGDDESYIEGGFTYLLSADTQIDANGGALLDSRTRTYFIGAGLAHRF